MARAYPQGPGIMPLGPQSAYAPEKQPPPGGYVTRTNDPNMKLALGRSVQMFTVRDLDSSIPTFDDYCNSVSLMQYDIGVNGAAWAIASVQAFQVRRRAIAAGVTPLPYSELLNLVSQCPPAFGANQVAQRYSSLRARFRWNDGSAAQRELITDISGGISIQVYARNISVDIIYPSEGYYAQGGVFNGDPEAVPGPGKEATDSMVSARCAPVDSLGAYILSRTPQLTESERTDNDNSQIFPIPSGATRASISVGSSILGNIYDIQSYSILRGTGKADAYRNPSPGTSNATIDLDAGAEGIRIESTSAGAGGNVFSIVYEINP